MLIHYQNSSKKELLTAGGRVIQVQVGEITGILDASKFVDPIRCTEDMGYTTWQFDFKARGGRCHRYSALINPWTLWPNDEIVTTWSQGGDFTDSLAVATVMDSREPYCIRVAGDDPLTGFLKYTGMEVSIRIKEHAVACRMKFFHGEEDRRVGSDKSGYCVVYYDLPFERFLWRLATRFTAEDFYLYGEPFIHLTETRELDVPESAIDVVAKP